MHAWPLYLCLILTSCGWHFRGHQSLPTAYQQINFDSHLPHSSFSKTLNQAFRLRKMDVDSGARYPYTLHIIDELAVSTPRSISATTQTREYDLLFSVKYQLKTINNKIIIPPRQVSAHRRFLQNANRMLGSSREEKTLRAALERDVATQLINQLNQQLRTLNHKETS